MGSGYNYDRTIPKWVNKNYPRTSVYDDAQVNILEEALPFQMNNKSKGIEIHTRDPKHKSYNFEDSTKLGQTILEFVLSIELKDMSPQNVPRLIMK